MVKSYTRFELAATFGTVSGQSNILSVPGGTSGHVVVGAGEAILIWDLKTAELVARLYDSAQPPAAQALRLAYEPSTGLVAAGYTDGSIRVWDLSSGQCLITFNGHKSPISTLVFDASGTRLISGSHDTNIVVWDLVEEVGLYRLRGHRAPVTALVLVTDNWLISTSKDGIVKLWDLETQFSVESHVAHKGECWAACLSPDHKRLFTVPNAAELRVWDIDLDQPEGERIKLVGALDRANRHRGISVHCQEDLVIVASGDVVQSFRQRTTDELHKALRRKEKRAKKKDENATVELAVADMYVDHSHVRTKAKIVGMVPGEKQGDVVVNLAVNSIEEYRLGAEAERIHAIELPGHRSDVRDLALSADGKLVASGSNGQIKIYNTRSQVCVRTLDGTGYVLALKFLPGDKLLVAATKEGNIDLYDITTSTVLGSYPAHEGSVWSLDVASDGQSIVSGGADKSVKFWALKVVEQEVPGHPDVRVPQMTLKNTHKIEFNDDVLAVKLSPDGRLVAASLLDNTIKVYYRETLKFFLNLYGHQLPVLSLDISDDSKLLISSSADKNIKIWGLDFGDCHKSIFAHDDAVLQVAFEPQTKYFFSCGKDGLVKYWDAIKFTQIQRLQGHHGEVWALAVAQDGSFLVTASHDKSMRIWEMIDEPLFIEEEREAEMEQQYEETLAENLDRDHQQELDGDATEDSGQAVSRQTIESLKAGERLYEALDICITDLEEKPNPRHVILATLDVPPERYLMDTLLRIKPALVEDALLTFPLDRVTGLFKFVLIWIRLKWNVPLVCRVLLFCLRNFHRQLVANKLLEAELQDIRDELRTVLLDNTDKLGFNLAQLKYIKDMWDVEHIRGFDDEPSVGGIKRQFAATSL